MKTDIARILSTFTSRRHEFLVYPPAVNGCSEAALSTLLSHFLPDIEPTSWSERISFGGAHVNGIRVEDDRLITLPCKLEYFEPVLPLEVYAQQFPAWSEEWICYEDNDLIVVAKPAGLPTFPSREQKQFSLRSYLDTYLGYPAHFPSRIDTSTSGLVIASKSPQMHAPLQQSFEKRRIEKFYVLASEGTPEWRSISLRGNIARTEAHPVLRSVSLSRGKSAQTTVWVLGHYQERCIMLAKPLSGRTHQIRVHLADAGYPLAGDNFYGGSKRDSLHLTCFKLRLPDPRTGVAREFCLPETLCPSWILPFLVQLQAW